MILQGVPLLRTTVDEESCHSQSKQVLFTRWELADAEEQGGLFLLTSHPIRRVSFGNHEIKAFETSDNQNNKLNKESLTWNTCMSGATHPIPFKCITGSSTISIFRFYYLAALAQLEKCPIYFSIY